MKTQSLLVTLNILTWVVLIGLLIKAGAILFLFGYSMIKPEVSMYLYQGLDMSAIRETNVLTYSYMSFLFAAGPTLMAVISGIMIGVFSRMNLESPFTLDIADRLRKVSFVLIGSWIIAVLTSIAVGKVEPSGEHLFAAGLVFIIAQIFRRGVEIQSENDLTV